MTENAKPIHSYELGDNIKLALKVSDPSGVERIVASFAEKYDTTKQLYLYGDGGGATDAEVVVETKVIEGTAPGEYFCFQLDLTDKLGNRRLISNPGIEFRVAEVPGDHEGPELQGWRLLKGKQAEAERFFIGYVYRDLDEAKKAADERGIFMFVVIFDARHPKKSKLNYSLGYFMEYQTTKKLVNENFVQVLLDSSDPRAAELVPGDDPLENCRLVVLTPDGDTIRSEGVYANPDEGLRRVREDIQKWAGIKRQSS